MNKFKQVIAGLKTDVICLQETTWSNELMVNVKKVWEGDMYISNGNNRACGVAILLKGEKILNVQQIHNDGKGRMLGIDFNFQGETF